MGGVQSRPQVRATSDITQTQRGRFRRLWQDFTSNCCPRSRGYDPIVETLDPLPRQYTTVHVGVQCEQHPTTTSVSVQCEQHPTTTSVSVQCEPHPTTTSTSVQCGRTNAQEHGILLATLVMELIELVHMWYLLGVLLGIPYHTLAEIESDHSKAARRCFTEMLSIWLKEGESPSWQSLCHVLDRMGKKNLARKIAKKHDLPPPIEDADDKSKPASKTKLKPKAYLQEINSKFAQLIDTLLEHFNGKLDVKRVGLYLLNCILGSEAEDDDSLPEQLMKSLREASDLADIFFALRQHHIWDFQNCELLMELIECFGDEVARKELQSYYSKRDKYQSDTTLKQFAFAQATLDPEHVPTVTGFMKECILKLDDNWNNCTLQDAENLIRNLVSLPRGKLILLQVREGSIMLVLKTHPSVIPAMKQEVEKKRRFMRYAGVLEFNIDKHPITAESREESQLDHDLVQDLQAKLAMAEDEHDEVRRMQEETEQEKMQLQAKLARAEEQHAEELDKVRKLQQNAKQEKTELQDDYDQTHTEMIQLKLQIEQKEAEMKKERANFQKEVNDLQISLSMALEEKSQARKGALYQQLVEHKMKFHAKPEPPTLSSRPSMMQLVRFPGRTRKIEISQEVASNFHFFGTLLLEDSYGAVVASIAKEFESDLEQASLEILRQWVEGRGKQPVTWDTLIKVIREMEYESLAAEIEATLSEEQQWQLYSSASMDLTTIAEASDQERTLHADSSSGQRTGILFKAPQLFQLARLKGKHKNINVFLEIGSCYYQFGILLLDDSTGAQMEGIEQEYGNDTEQMNQEVVENWLMGKGRDPVVWGTLIKVLYEVGLAQLASDVEAALHELQDPQEEESEPEHGPMTTLSSESSPLHERPNLPQLISFEGRTSIPQKISNEYYKFGILLLEDSTGAVTQKIKHKHSSLDRINMEILRQWIEGRGKQPVTWETLIEVIREINLIVLAQEIVEGLTKPVFERHQLQELELDVVYRKPRMGNEPEHQETRASYSLSGGPTMEELLDFQGKDRKINLPQEIGSNVLELLLQNSAITEVECTGEGPQLFQKWLEGEGKQPVTWGTLIQVLEDAGVLKLAHEIQDACTNY